MLHNYIDSLTLLTGITDFSGKGRFSMINIHTNNALLENNGTNKIDETKQNEACVHW